MAVATRRAVAGRRGACGAAAPRGRGVAAAAKGKGDAAPRPKIDLVRQPPPPPPPPSGPPPPARPKGHLETLDRT